MSEKHGKRRTARRGSVSFAPALATAAGRSLFPSRPDRLLPANQPGLSLAPPAALQVRYQPLHAAGESGRPLAALCFGARADIDAGLAIHVGLQQLGGPAMAEVWAAQGEIISGVSGHVRHASDGHHLFAVIELDEREHGGVLNTARTAYAAINEFQRRSEYPCLLRMWNHLDDINEGAGDLERYRQFCVGRGQAMVQASAGGYPSATAVGRHQSDHLLQVFWLAGRAPGQTVENPRQVNAYHYPRVHGPVSPGFSRAMVSPDRTLFISGTASIVGHVSRHHGDAQAQFDEIMRNIATLCAEANHVPGGSPDLFKVYVRDTSLAQDITAQLQALHPDSQILCLAADICRRELLLEIEAIFSAPAIGHPL